MATFTDDIFFATISELNAGLKSKQFSAVELVRAFAQRLEQLGPRYNALALPLTAIAIRRAREVDKELKRERYRGPLQGIPFGAKDLLSYADHPTTWGARPYAAQTFDYTATLLKKLDNVGAVLVGKLAMVELAGGGGYRTAAASVSGPGLNPWDRSRWSGGSSSGSASAVAAGLVPFAIGSETSGSILTPAAFCGVTGLRPTYGLVSRHGAMALSWTMDKLGPICRAVEDTAIVLSAIHGPDGHDRTVHNAAFNWDATLDWRKLRVGYLKSDFELQPPPQQTSPQKEEKELTEDEKKKQAEEKANRAQAIARREYDHKFDEAALAKLRAMGVNLIPVEFPKYPYGAMRSILLAEAAAAFDDLTRSGRDKLLTQQTKDDWPNTFRAARFIPAVEYIQANRARTTAMEMAAKVFDQVDVIVAPTFSTQLLITNLTGHPALVLPNGFRGPDSPPARVRENGEVEGGGPGTPLSLTFLGQLYGEARMLALAKAYQDATDFHHKHPQLDMEGKK